VKVTQEECDKLVALYKLAENTPIIVETVQDGLDGKDLATLAWKAVRSYYDELAKKYGFNPTKQAINSKTLEIIDL
jgi:hypothetical protein